MLFEGSYGKSRIYICVTRIVLCKYFSVYFCLYEAQLNSYALIAEHRGFSPVSQSLLLYYEPQSEITESSLEGVLQVDGFSMPFKGFFREVRLDPVGIVLPLLRQVKELAERGSLPEGRQGCKDCKVMRRMEEMWNKGN